MKSRSELREISSAAIKIGTATVAGLAAWVVGGKILAVELGAAGVGVFGLLRALLQNLGTYASFNGGNALVQGIASAPDAERSRYAHSVATLYALGAAVVALALSAAAPWVAPLLLPHPEAPVLLRWLALAVLATTAQGYFLGVLNGHRAVNALVRAQLVGPVTVLALAVPTAALVRQGNAAGFVLLLAAPPGAVALAAMYESMRSGWFSPCGIGRVHRDDVSRFFRAAAVLVVSGLLVTGTQYLLNRLVVARFGLAGAGQFWVAWTLSMTYVTVLLGAYGSYYMPALSAAVDQPQRVALIRDYFGLALAVTPLLVSTVILIKPLIVVSLFSANLLPSLGVMRWMLLGDFFKCIGWVFAFPLLAFNELRAFFWSELLFHVALAGGASAWLALGGSMGSVGVVFAASYACYAVAMLAYVVHRHGFRVRRDEAARFGAGMGLVALVSVLTWSDERVRLAPSLALTVLGGVYAIQATSALRRQARVSA